MMSALKKWGINLLGIVAVLAGIFIFKTSVAGREEPEKRSEPAQTLAVEVETVRREQLDRVLTGYGTVVPARTWRAVPQVSGKVVQVHPNLRTGGLIGAGETLFSIETVDQALEQRRIEAENRASRAEIRQIQARREKLEASLASARQTLALLKKEEQRYQNLFEAGAAAATTVDARHREVLNQERLIEEIESSITTIPDQISGIEARLDAARVQSQKQDVQAGRATVRAPFAGRLGEVYLEAGQVVTAGSQLFTLQGSEQLRVEARFPTAQLSGFPLRKAWVIVDGGERYPARIGPLREQIDQTSLTATLQLTVSAPRNPDVPFLPGALVRVELVGDPHPPAPVVPRTAIRNGQVFLVKDGVLTRHSVDVAFREGEKVALRGGVQAGDKLVVSDPGLAGDGTPVRLSGGQP